MLRALAAALVLAAVAPAVATCPVESPLEPPCGLAPLESMRDAFIARSARAGIPLPYSPEVREWTRPLLVAWRRDARAVAVPRWEELTREQRALVVRMAGSEPRAPELFAWLYRWFLLPHELAHAAQDELGDWALPPSRSERAANDLAVAFHMEQPMGRERLARLAGLLEAAAARLDPPPGGADADRWFDAHQDELARDPARHGAFQLRFILDSIRRRDALAFDAEAGRLRAAASRRGYFPKTSFSPRKSRTAAAARRAAQAAVAAIADATKVPGTGSPRRSRAMTSCSPTVGTSAIHGESFTGTNASIIPGRNGIIIMSDRLACAALKPRARAATARRSGAEVGSQCPASAT